MTNMKKGILALGLVGLLAGCEAENPCIKDPEGFNLKSGWNLEQTAYTGKIGENYCWEGKEIGHEAYQSKIKCFGKGGDLKTDMAAYDCNLEYYQNQ